ncbi:MAG: hypothetical protein R3B06_16710 [Kofleriaceae bacterium]
MGIRRTSSLVALAAVAVLGCSRTFQAEVVQPNPLVKPTETLRDSEVVRIVTGDMELNVPREAEQRVSVLRNKRYPLNNQASFTLVSRDRLRFHVQLEHKWQEWADLASWEVYMVDDRGHRYLPEGIEHAHTKHLVSMWDREVRSVQRNMYGDIIAINEDGWRRRQTLGSLSVFRGTADFVFYQRDLFTPDLRKLTLVVRRSGQAFEFTWNFADRVANN